MAYSPEFTVICIQKHSLLTKLRERSELGVLEEEKKLSG